MIRAKICGLTRLEDARLASELGAWALGFIFHPPSPRYIAPSDAAALISGLPSTPALRVGVFVDESPEVVASIAMNAGLSAAQLHGDESPEYCAALKRLAPGLRLIKAFRIREGAPIPEVDAYGVCDWILVDSYSQKQHGGTGKTAPWKIANELARRRPTLLAGGIRAANVADAIREVNPFAVDLSSSLENPGDVSKDATKMKEFFDAVRRLA